MTEFIPPDNDTASQEAARQARVAQRDASKAASKAKVVERQNAPQSRPSRWRPGSGK